MKKTLLTVIGAVAMTASLHAQTLIAGWDFQTTTNGGTAAAAAPGAPLVYLANVGTQAGSAGIYLDGTHGSSTFTSAASSPQVTGFAGTTVNLASGMASGASVSSLAVANSSANGFSITIAFSMAGITDDLAISYASQRTSTGFTGNQWAYSTDGVNFTDFGSSIVPAASFAVVSLPTLSALSGATTAYLRYTITGATSTGGNNRLDNIQINTVPEPSTYAMLLGGIGATLWIVRRKRAIKA